MKTRKTTILIAAAFLAIAMFALAGCGGQNEAVQGHQDVQPQSDTSQLQAAQPAVPTGFGDAYAKLQDAAFTPKQLEASYDESGDSLSLVIGGDESTLDDIFAILNDAVEGKSCGTLDAYIEFGYVSGDSKPGSPQRQAMLSKLGAYIGAIPCESLERLSVGRLIDDMVDEKQLDAAWTNILPKTDTLNLEWGTAASLLQYFGNDAQDNLDHVTRLEIGSRYKGGAFAYVPNVEELVFTSGSDEDDKREAQRLGITWDYNDRDRMNDLADLSALERVIFLPDLDDWNASADYYKLMMAFQAGFPDVLTNAPGASWDGNADTLVPIADIDIRENIGDSEYADLRSGMLKLVAKASFDKGQDFEMASGQPKLDGPTLVYLMMNPYNLEWSDYSQFSSNGSVLQDELGSTGVEVPGDDFKHDYLVYAYPTFEPAGEYVSGTKAYSTTVNVQVYDMKNHMKYEPVVIDTLQPPESKVLANEGSYAPEIEPPLIASYVAGLA